MVGIAGRSGGANKKPSGLRLVEGTWRKDRARPGEPRPPVGVPRPPKSLSPGARHAYRRLAKAAALLGVLCLADREALVLLAETAEELRQARELIEKGGPFYWTDTRAGRVLKPNPAIRVRESAARRYRDLLRDFGLTPQSRAGVEALELPSDQARREEERLGRKYFGSA